MAMTFKNVVFAGVLLVGGLVVVAGCSDDTSLSPAGSSKLQCGTTLKELANQACQNDSPICTVQVRCTGGFDQLVTCNCEKGAYACKGPDDAVLGPDSTPACVSIPAPKPGPCPATLIDADGKVCTLAGQNCTYPSVKCLGDKVDGPGNLDYCRCQANGKDLNFVCQARRCNGDAGVVVTPVLDASSGG